MKNLYYNHVPTWAADVSLELVQRGLLWHCEQTIMFGRKVTMPRLVAFHGEGGVNYLYSGIDHTAAPWTDMLKTLRQCLTQSLSVPADAFNGCLANFYRNGRDYMGWHTDDERALKPDHPIALLSFGATRRFGFRPRKDRNNNRAHFLDLSHGDLLVFYPRCQQDLKHALPKSMRVTEPRISLTFRSFR